MRIARPAVAALAACTALLPAAPARADSSVSSAASNSASASVGSLSTSLERSSKSSENGRDVAAGEYRVVEIAAAPGPGHEGHDSRDGLVRLRLEAVAGSGAEGEFFLYLPQAALEQGGVAVGQRLSARTRPYGTEFAQAESGRTFFLLLADEWYRELRTRPVGAG